MDFTKLISDRARSVDSSGIRRVFELGAKMVDKIDLSIGQPHFKVPEPIKHAAARAVEHDHNAYTPTQGIPKLRERLAQHLEADVGWNIDPRAAADADPSRPGVMVCSGTAGALVLACLAVLDAGDEAIIPDPYFVMYPALATMLGAKAVRCDTYPDFRMTAERVAPLITARTKLVLLNSPGNPSGVVASGRECAELEALCRSRGVLLISDEIYDEFTFSDAREVTSSRSKRCPSPARAAGSADGVLLIRGFGKTYGVTGWRLGYAAGPRALIEQMCKLQQYTFVCAPSPLQHGAAAALDVDMQSYIDEYQRNRDLVVERLSSVTELATPGGAFYAFVKIPDRLGLTGAQFFEKARERKVLVVPGKEFSARDTHFRLSFATDRDNLARGLDVLVDLMR